jgi:hypothetical protein
MHEKSGINGESAAVLASATNDITAVHASIAAAKTSV